MGVPTSEVGYTSATTRRETTKYIRDMWWHWIKKKKKSGNINRYYNTIIFSVSQICIYDYVIITNQLH
jgi:hypothetical protein